MNDKKLIISEPLPLRTKYKDGNVFIEFQYAGDGLKMSDNQKFWGFSIDGKNDVQAVIRQGKVVYDKRNSNDCLIRVKTIRS